MWYAIRVDDGIVGTFETKREAVLRYSDNGKSKRMYKGAYEVVSDSEDCRITTCIFDSKQSAEYSGFGWAFEEENEGAEQDGH